MDDLDQQLLAKLRENARAPVAELARGLGLSRTPIQSRLLRLERSGVIAGYSLKLSDKLEAAQVRGLVMLSAEPKQAAAVSAALKRLAGGRRLQSVSGPYDLAASIAAPSMAELDALIEEIQGLPGVERVQASVVLATRFDR